MKKSVMLFALVILCSCNQEEQKRIKHRSVRTSKIDKIKKEFNIKHSITDSSNFDFSYQFNPAIKAGKQLMEFYTVHDIYTKNNKNYVGIETYRFYFDLLIENEEVLNELKNNEDKYHRVENKILVLELENIRKMPFAIDISEDGQDTYMEVTEGNRFIGKGKILQLIKI